MNDHDLEEAHSVKIRGKKEARKVKLLNINRAVHGLEGSIYVH